MTGSASVRDPAEREIDFRLATLRAGIWLSVIVSIGVAAYALATWERPYRQMILVGAALGILTAPAIMSLPTAHIVRGRRREAFFVGWSAADIALIALGAAADGGIRSPFVLLFALPLLFGCLSYPSRVTALVGTLDVVAFAAVWEIGGGSPTYGAFGLFALICAALLATWESHSQSRRRQGLAQTAQALHESEGLSRLQARQQEAVARFGQLALGGATVDQLLAEAPRVVERVLGVDISAVLQILPEEDAFITRAAVGLPGDAIGTAMIPTGTGSQAGYTLATGTPVIVRNWAQETRFAQPELIAERGMRSGLTTLIRSKGKPYGVLGAESRPRREFTSEDVSFMQAIANVLATSIERRTAEDRARYEALHDPLTGLANRNLFLDRLGQALAEGLRNDTRVAVLFMDLDQFKLVNDSLGHAAGDELLTAVAPRLDHAVRPGDTVARFGGDEFAVLVKDIFDEREAILVAERIVEVLAAPFRVRQREHYVSASIGISIGSAGETPEALLRDADAALYRAKDRGRGHFEVFDAEMRARVLAHVRTENDLRRALDEGEFELYYQPVVSLRDGSVDGLEALLRWNHPERGRIGPAEFIPIAEESRLIIPIGRWVIEEACRKAASWQQLLDPDSRPVAVAVNLSPRQLADHDLARAVDRALSASKIDPATLSLELTESVFLEDSDLPGRTIESLTGLGAKIVLDDFGSGFSSLGYLKRFPLAAIKLDRSFVENISAGSADAAIVRAVADMADALGLDVVAEGVETGAQLEAVRVLGCSHAQGYYFARPVRAAEVEGLLITPPWLESVVVGDDSELRSRADGDLPVSAPEPDQPVDPEAPPTDPQRPLGSDPRRQAET